jgi:hypothetical protein
MVRKVSRVVAACATATGLFIGVSPNSPLAPTSARADATAPACSWAGESDPRDVNEGAPDTNADYWYGALDGAAGNQIEITGAYPHARYFSFTLYNADQQALTSIYDQQIVPDARSYNPYLGPGARGEPSRYTLHVLFEDAPAHPAPNTLYAGPPTATNTAGFMILRIYLPVGSVSGGVDFPQIKVLTASGATELDEGACSTTPPSFGAWYWQDQAQASAPSDQSTPADGTTSPPVWTKSFDNGFGNQQNSYLQVLVSHHWGELVVAHFRASTFPNTTAGEPVYGKHDLRYWSVCTYDSSGTAVFGCAADHQIPQTGGWVTLVVSDPGHRPRNATSADGVAWLPWSPNNEIQIMERNMLPAAGFTGASQQIATPAQNPQAAQIMGTYYPTSAYCATATFERGGWQACLPALARALAIGGAPARYARCPAPTGTLEAASIGLVRLGTSRTALRRLLPRHRAMANPRFDDFCLASGRGIRVGFLHGKAVLAMTGNAYYRYAGIAPGTRLRAALRRLRRVSGPIRRGPDAWYAVRLARSTLFIKTAHGVVAEIGIGVPTLTASQPQQRRLLARLGA